MQYLKISNKGVLDIRLFSLMGGTTKRGDSGKIGQFGTGLKYTMAYLLRENIGFRIFLGGEEVKITTKPEDIRDEVFDIVYVNGERTSLVTKMGVEWKAWMILREIWCNALDEEEAKYEIVDEVEEREGYTEFYIQSVGEIKKVAENWQKYFIHDIEPIWENDDFAVYKALSEKRMIYKNGVLISVEKQKEKCLFSYDFKNAELNELRKYNGGFHYEWSQCIKQFDAKTAEYMMNNMSGYYEENCEWGYSYGPYGEGWKEAIGEAKIIGHKVLEKMVDRGAIDEGAKSELIALPDKLFRDLSDKFDGVSAVMASRTISSFMEVESQELTLKLKQALVVLESCDYYVSEELNFKFGVFGNDSKLAQVDKAKKEVYISEVYKDRSLYDMCTMLIEENEHFRTGYSDCSRLFQSHFIDMYTKILFEKNDVKL